MSGTGPTPAEQHLGDRLAALVDGELKHDVRERVLAHLATCAKCKAEAAAQRRLKSVFAQSAPPSPSEGLLARLQGLPGGPWGDDDGRGGPFGDSGRFTDVFLPMVRRPGSRTDAERNPGLGDFGYLPDRPGSTAVLPRGSSRADFRLPGGSARGAFRLPGASARTGFRIHEVGRETDRAASRGRRFAFAAAGAVSLAAIALGGALQTGAGPGAPVRAAGAGNAVTPLDTTRGESGSSAGRRGGSGESDSSTGRRGGSGQSAPATTEAYDRAGTPTDPPTAPAVPYAAPVLSASTTGLPDLSGGPDLLLNTLDVQVLPHVSAPPLIRPTGTTPLFAQVLGRPASTPPPTSPVPSWTPSPATALPTPTEQGTPLSSWR
ncbi:zf-HC2 domain-containing protein [Streptomyces sp. NPDC001834]|uniref:zf-HC2 domain-containing protein n=1 Tax=Streptomyces sp. NPDC001834 TaxID=3364616 RepID=UPI0036BCCA48